MNLYSAFDVKANEYYSPFEAAHDTAASREIQRAMLQNMETNRFVIHRSEYVLVRLGDFDISTGVFETAAPAPVTTFSALFDDLKAKVPNE